METSDKRIPITLLTGFLGSGKTTLLNHLIRDPDAGRIAVIMNEFGDVGLDHDLIEEATEETILMQSGCICCTIRGDIAKTLGALMARLKRGELAFDRIVIETTGIADPGPILHTLVMDADIAPYFRMDGVVTLADAATGPATLDKQFEAVHQIAVADLVIVSKSDLVTPAQSKRFEDRIENINVTARRLRADHGRVPPKVLFGLSGMRSGVTTSEVDDWLGAMPSVEDPLAGLSGFSPKPVHSEPMVFGMNGLDQRSKPKEPSISNSLHHHDNRIVSASIEVDAPIPASVFDFWLDTLIALKGANILRMKGIVHVEDVQWPFVFHGVQHIFDSPIPLKSWAGGDPISRVVVIARDMTTQELEASLFNLHMRPKAEESEGGGMIHHSAEIEF